MENRTGIYSSFFRLFQKHRFSLFILTATALVFFIMGYVAGLFPSNRLNETVIVPSVAPTITPTPRPLILQQSRTNTAITLAPTRKEGEYAEVLARNFEYPKGVTFSFRYPKPDYCHGCYDGGGQDYQDYYYFSGEIVNQLSSDLQPESEKWVIQYAVTNGSLPLHGDWAIINKDFLKETETLAMGEMTILKSGLDPQYTYAVTRIGSRTVDGVAAQTYESDWKSNTAGGKTRYAVFRKGGYIYILAVMTSAPHNDYIFDLVLSSFQFNLRPAAEVYSP